MIRSSRWFRIIIEFMLTEIWPFVMVAEKKTARNIYVIIIKYLDITLRIYLKKNTRERFCQL